MMQANHFKRLIWAFLAVLLLGGAAYPGAVPLAFIGPFGYMAGGAVLSFLITAAALHVAHRRIQEKTELGFRSLLESFQQLADTNRMALAYWNKDGVLTDANETFLSLLGCSRDQVRTGKLRLRDLTPTEFQERDNRGFEELKRDGVAAPYEKEYQRPDGTRVPVLQGLALLEDSRHHGLTFLHDLTERRRYERALRDSEALYQSLVEHLPMQIYRKDKEGRIVFGNERFWSMLGKSAEQGLGQTAYDYYPRELAEKYDTDDRLVVETGEVFHDVEEHHDGKGNQLYVEVLKTAVRDHEGQVVGTQGIFWDVTARKLAEQSLRQSEQRFAAFMNHVPGAACVKDGQGRFLFANAAHAAILNKTPADLLGKTEAELGRAAPIFAGGEEAVRAGDVPASTVETVTQGNQQQHWLVCKFPIPSGNGAPLVGSIALDVSELRRAQDALENERNFMAAIQDSARLLVVVLDRQGGIVRFNKTCEQVTGFALDEIKGKKFWDLVAVPEEAALVKNAFAGPVDKLPKGFVDHLKVKGEGGERLIEWNNIARRTAGGEYFVCTGLDITERSRAEEALNETQARQRLLHEQVPAVLWTTDRELRFTSGAGAGMNEVGLHDDQSGFTGLSLYSYLHTDDPDHVTIAAHRRALAGEKVTVDSEWLGRVFHSRIEPFVDANGDIIGCIGVALDITERKRAEDALAESKALVETLLASAPFGCALYDRDLRYVQINDTLVRINGVPADETIGKSLHEVLPQQLADGVETAMRQVLDTGTPVSNVEMFAATQVGEQRHWLVHYYPVNVGGEVIGVAAAVTDVTILKQATEEVQRLNAELEARVIERTAELEQSQEELRRQTSILQSVLNSMGEGVAVTDEQGRFIVFNPAGAEIIGEGPIDAGPAEWSRAYGLFRMDGITPYPEDELPLVRAMRGEETSNYELIVRNANKPTGVYLSVTGRPLRDETGRHCGAVAVFHDVTERKQAEQELRRLHDVVEQRALQLEAANRELEAFSYSVSHDLRAPLRAIDGFSRILLQEHSAGLSEEASHYLERVRINAHQMGELIDNLLSFSRLGRQPLQKQDINTRELVEHILEDLRGERDGRDVEIALGDLPPCQGDPLLVRQVFFNLLGNALKYSRGRHPARIEIGAQADNGSGGQIFYVRDNGVGFDMRYAAKLFGVFQRLHRAEDYEGTGVGLASAQRIIHRHGGRIWADAQVEHGATFSFTLEGSNGHGA